MKSRYINSRCAEISSFTISLFAYLLSSYALTISVIGFKRVIRRIRELITGDEVQVIVKFRKLMHKNKLTALYLDSKDFRAEVSLYCGLAFNLFFAAFKVTSGIHDGSAWLISIGFYYFACLLYTFTEDIVLILCYYISKYDCLISPVSIKCCFRRYS